jgi:hypothetical protein
LNSSINNKNKPSKKRWISIFVIIIISISLFIWLNEPPKKNNNNIDSSFLVLNERIVIEEVNIKNSGHCTIYVRNIGKTDVSISNINITIPNGEVFIYNSVDFHPLTEYVPIGELITIENIPISYLTGNYIVKVITPRGISDTYEVIME